jgi:hypothetical protein
MKQLHDTKAHLQRTEHEIQINVKRTCARYITLTVTNTYLSVTRTIRLTFELQ